MTDLHRAGQILQDTVQSCTARHPSVTSVALWTSVQLYQDCPDSPGFADERMEEKDSEKFISMSKQCELDKSV
jgi:hypothetical protein